MPRIKIKIPNNFCRLNILLVQLGVKEAGDVEEVDVPHIPHDEPERDGHGVAGGPGGDGDEVEHVACPAEEEDARPAHPHDERDRFLRLIPRSIELETKSFRPKFTSVLAPYMRIIGARRVPTPVRTA